MNSRFLRKLILLAVCLISLADCSVGGKNVTSAPTSHTSSGGEAGGGGNTIVPLSTSDEISKAIDDAREKFLHTFTMLGSGLHGDVICRGVGVIGGPSRIVHKPRLLQIMDDFSKDCKIADAGTFSLPRLETMVEKTIIEKRLHGPCDTEGGAHREGAVLRMSDPNSPICISIDLLQRLPRELMEEQVLGLIAHEFTHKFGYGESDAVLMQKYFITEIANNKALLRNELARTLHDVQEIASDAMKPGASKAQMCESAAPLDSAIKVAAGYVRAIDNSNFRTKHPSKDLMSLEMEFFDLSIAPAVEECNLDNYSADQVRDRFRSYQGDEFGSLALQLLPIDY